MSDYRICALVTGASSGIGAAYADRLAARGYDLILVARRRDRLEALAAQLRQDHGRQVEVHAADLGSSKDLGRIETLLQTREDIALLVNNAGLGALGPGVSVDPQAVQSLIAINVLALTRLSLAAAPAFTARNQGAIINIGSVIAVIPSPGGAAYSGSKAYVLNFSRSLQIEFSETNVKVQVVMPGPVRSEFFGDSKPPFPDDLFMSAETLVDIALRALDQGELVCWPTLHDLQVWTNFEHTRRLFIHAATQDAIPPERYGVAAPEAAV